MYDSLSEFPVVVEIPVAWGDMDAFQHVNNTVYFRYVESARMAYFDRLGLIEIMKETGVGPILAAINCHFLKPLTYPDTISVGSRVSEIGQDHFVMKYCLVSHKLKAVTAQGDGTLFTFDYHKKHIATLPDEVRRRIEEIEKI